MCYCDGDNSTGKLYAVMDLGTLGGVVKCDESTMTFSLSPAVEKCVTTHVDKASYAPFCKSLKEKIAQFIFADVAAGLAYLHHPAIRIVNRDIKPENIVFATLEGGTSEKWRDRALIVDFTTAEKIPEGKEETFKVCRDGGTPAFEAPECLTGDHRPMPLDVWALGVSIVCVVYGKLPFPADASVAELENAISTLEPAYPEGIEVSGELKAVLADLLEKDPSKRITIQEAIDKHDWLKV